MTHSAVLILRFGQMLAPPDVKPHIIELHTIPFTMRDGMMLIIGCALLVLALL
jgi:nitrite reductase/ring-hydroxylating ferredoxin subunit